MIAKGTPPRRSRFSNAHELGHFLIPSHRPRMGCPFECSLNDLHMRGRSSSDWRKKVEAQANQFAADLLMPPARIRAAIQQSAVRLESIVAIFRSHYFEFFRNHTFATDCSFLHAEKEPP